MSIRSDVVYAANWWAYPGEWKPQPGEICDFFEYSGAESAPSIAEAESALRQGGTGVYIGKSRKQWCGVFACFIARYYGGCQARWSLNEGKLLNLEFVWSREGMQPGDIAVINDKDHHFIVTDVDYSTKSMKTVEGNTSGQLIRNRKRSTSEPYGYYRLPE